MVVCQWPHYSHALLATVPTYVGITGCLIYVMEWVFFSFVPLVCLDLGSDGTGVKICRAGLREVSGNLRLSDWAVCLSLTVLGARGWLESSPQCGLLRAALQAFST